MTFGGRERERVEARAFTVIVAEASRLCRSQTQRRDAAATFPSQASRPAFMPRQAGSLRYTGHKKTREAVQPRAAFGREMQ